VGGWRVSVGEEQARVGARVKVLDHNRRPNLVGETGTIVRIYRSSSQMTGLPVRLDDGRWQLLWPQDVQPLAEESPPVESTENL
jgi:hypothetical protein